MMSSQPDSLLHFSRPYLSGECVAAATAVLNSGWLASGPRVREFEERLSETFGMRPTRAVTSATAGLELALSLCDVGHGDGVILSPQTFFAAMNMILRRGACPIFVDCTLERRSLLLDEVERAVGVGGCVKAIIETHFPGEIHNLDMLYEIAGRKGVRVIEDCALVQGSTFQGRPIGGQGDIAIFSFHPNKNMTTIEGGAIVVPTLEEARLVERLRFHGIDRTDSDDRDVAIPGGKFNLPDVNAAIGLSQLRMLPGFLRHRAELVSRYLQAFPPIPGALQPSCGEFDQSWNMFMVLLPFDELGISRRRFRAELLERGVATGTSYEACHLTTAGRHLGYRPGQFPNAERIARHTINFPLHVGMTIADVDRVCETVAEVTGIRSQRI